MKSLKIAKMNIEEMIKPITIYYCIYITIITALILSDGKMNGIKASTAVVTEISGVEIVTAIFLFICGLNSFKSNFYFVRSNNISRRTFIKGMLISTFPIVFITSFLDIVINRFFNIFTVIPTFYDMIYGIGPHGYTVVYGGIWTQSNSLIIIFNTILFQFTLGIFAYVAGIAINMIYYRCNKQMKIIVLIAIITTFIIQERSHYVHMKIEKLNNFIFGLSPLNVYRAVGTFTFMSLALFLLSFLLIRKMVIKER